jgi:hypothetical protein
MQHQYALQIAVASHVRCAKLNPNVSLKSYASNEKLDVTINATETISMLSIDFLKQFTFVFIVGQNNEWKLRLSAACRF